MRHELFIIAAKKLGDVLAMRSRVEKFAGSKNIYTVSLDSTTAENISSLLEEHHVVLYVPLSRYRVAGYTIFPRVGTPEIEFNLQNMLKYQSSEFLSACPITPRAFNVIRSRWTATRTAVFQK